MIIEGPMITAASALAASLGYLNIYLIIIMSMSGDVIGDIIHYYIGRTLRKTVIESYIKKHGINRSIIKKLEKKIHNNLWKSMTIIKITPPLATPGLLLVGATRVPALRYLFMSFLTTLPLTAFYVSLGYYFGFSVKVILDSLKLRQYEFFFVLVAFVLIFLLYRAIYKKINKAFHLMNSDGKKKKA